MTRWCCLLLLLASTALPITGQQSLPRQAAAGDPGIIRGRIRSADNGRPLRRATVSLRPDAAPTARPILSVSTNAQGQFEMRDVPPGSYVVSASRSGYLEIQHGQRGPRERGVTIEVARGGVRDRIDIALPKGSVITGRIVDELGAPYPGVTVTALEVRYVGGERIYSPVNAVPTDDLGMYRLAGMMPGRYLLQATSNETWRNEKKETWGYAATFFPGTQAMTQAQHHTVGLGEERANADLELVANRTARVRGRALTAGGAPMAGEQVSLSRSLGEGIMLAGGTIVRTSADGGFEFRDVPPGLYQVRASGGGASASTLVAVAGTDIDQLVLNARTGSTVVGSFVTDTGERPPFPASGVRVSLLASPSASVLPTVRLPGVDNDWTVHMTAVAGPFIFRTVNLPSEWMLDAVRVGEREITDTPYDLSTLGPEVSDLVFVLTKQVGRIGGSVTTAERKPTTDATVVVFSNDASHWTVGSRYVRSTRPTPDGTFSISGLPAGTYLAVARSFIIEGEWETREFLEAARQDAARVTLERGGSETITLKLPRLAP
jgi:hypothetical protein